MAGLIWLWQQDEEPEPEPEFPPGQTWLYAMAMREREAIRLDPLKVCMFAFGCGAIRNPAIPQIAPQSARA